MQECRSSSAAQREALVVGAGPAGLMAAEELARAGFAVIIAEAKPSPARKFLMAGKSGLNLTKDEPLDVFLAQFGAARDWLTPALTAFGPAEVMAWAEGLGQPLFTGSTGRVFPVAMKGSPLLRAWLARLEAMGVTLRRGWRWTGFEGEVLRFETPDGVQRLRPARTVLALGGASWARLGSDGAWAPWLAAKEVPLAPYAPSNAGISLTWSPHMTPHFGAALKGVRLTAGGLSSRGEAAISARGLEGGGLYPLTPALREGARLEIDLFPDLSPEALAKRLTSKGKESLSNRLRKAGLDAARIALAQECARPLPAAAPDLSAQLKALALPPSILRPIDEVISTAGGVRTEGVDAGLQLKALPGIHVAGEMLDWEAPTGGYLLTASLATGRLAGRAAAGATP